MTTDEFLYSFQLNNLALTKQQQHLLTRPVHLRQSAVLIALIEQEEQLQVVLTKRASHLKHHSSQICLPGGKVEDSDKNYVATAIREAQEEIGIVDTNINIIGQLPPYQTITGFSITPVVALLDKNTAYQINKDEVSEIFHVPFRHFLNNEKHYSMQVANKTGNHEVVFMPYKHYNIWGATAAILKDLGRRF